MLWMVRSRARERVMSHRTLVRTFSTETTSASEPTSPIATPARTRAEPAMRTCSRLWCSVAGRNGRNGPSSASRSSPAARVSHSSMSARKASLNSAHGMAHPRRCGRRTQGLRRPFSHHAATKPPGRYGLTTQRLWIGGKARSVDIGDELVQHPAIGLQRIYALIVAPAHEARQSPSDRRRRAGQEITCHALFKEVGRGCMAFAGSRRCRAKDTSALTLASRFAELSTAAEPARANARRRSADVPTPDPAHARGAEPPCAARRPDRDDGARSDPRGWLSDR